MVSIKDVAKQAGVSVGVVSKAFNGYPDVNVKTRERIFEIAKEMKYSPNRVAKSLSSKQPSSVGLIASGFKTNDKKDNNSYMLFKGVYAGIEELNRDLSMYFTDSKKQKHKSYVQYCTERNIGGAILQGMRVDDPYFKELVDTAFPCVLIDVVLPEHNPYIGSISINNRKATEDMTNYLFERGHRDIVVMAGTKEAYVNEQRLLGVEDAYREHGLSLEVDKVIDADFCDQQAYEKAKAIFESGTYPSAFICFSDIMAYGVMRAAHDCGLSVPDDVSITGFDDSMISSLTQPGITTILQDFFEMGRQAAFLLDRIMNNRVETNILELDYQLLERGSVKDLR